MAQLPGRAAKGNGQPGDGAGVRAERTPRKPVVSVTDGINGIDKKASRPAA